VYGVDEIILEADNVPRSELYVMKGTYALLLPLLV